MTTQEALAAVRAALDDLVKLGLCLAPKPDGPKTEADEAIAGDIAPIVVSLRAALPELERAVRIVDGMSEGYQRHWLASVKDREDCESLRTQLAAAQVWREDVEAILDNEGPDGQPHDLTDRVSFCATEAKRAQERERKLTEAATWAIHEGHTLGRIYAERGEPEKPAEVWRDLQDRLEAKIAALTEGRAADAE